MKKRRLPEKASEKTSKLSVLIEDAFFLGSRELATYGDSAKGVILNHSDEFFSRTLSEPVDLAFSEYLAEKKQLESLIAFYAAFKKCPKTKFPKNALSILASNFDEISEDPNVADQIHSTLPKIINQKRLTTNSKKAIFNQQQSFVNKIMKSRSGLKLISLIKSERDLRSYLSTLSFSKEDVLDLFGNKTTLSNFSRIFALGLWSQYLRECELSDNYRALDDHEYGAHSVSSLAILLFNRSEAFSDGAMFVVRFLDSCAGHFTSVEEGRKPRANRSKNIIYQRNFLPLVKGV